MDDESYKMRIIELLEEVSKWKRFEGMQNAKIILKEIISKDSEKLAYQYSDGRGSKDVADLAGISDFSVRSYWKKWSIEGIMVPSQKVKGRYVRAFSLEDFGIDIPPLKYPKEESASNQEKKLGENNV